MVLQWMMEFERYPWVQIHDGDILMLEGDCIVSPANSFAFMDGGLDFALSERFGWDLQKKLQRVIQEKYRGELLVGQAEIIGTGDKDVPYLVAAPTMRVPMSVEGTMNPYLAARAVFLAVEEFNQEEHRIKRLLMPGLGTGVGKVPYAVAARQMRAAYEDVVLKRFIYPEDFAVAQHRHRGLSMQHFHDLYKGEY